jgi:hypothetical protein
MRKIKLIFAIFFALILIAPMAAQASCSWTDPIVERTQTVTGDSVVVSERNVCPADTTSGPKCDGTSKTGQLCCCNDDVVVADNKKTTILNPNEIFNWQVPIPNLKLSPVTCADKCEIPWISEYIFGAYRYLLTVGGVLAVVIMMAAGLLWIVSGGDSGKVGQAKTMIIGSVTGLLLLISMSLLLNYINPDLAKTSFISIDVIQKKSLEDLAISRKSTTEEKFRNSGCATDAELAAGVTFYATGYYKPAYVANDAKFLCVIAMQCSCPNGRDMTKNCDSLYGKTFPNYHPCIAFGPEVPYCNMTSSGTVPKLGDIAGPKSCTGNLPPGTKVCFKGKTYTITDTGGGIDGKRIDIWSGNSLDQAYANTGSGTLTKGACPTD